MENSSLEIYKKNTPLEKKRKKCKAGAFVISHLPIMAEKSVNTHRSGFYVDQSPVRKPDLDIIVNTNVLLIYPVCVCVCVKEQWNTEEKKNNFLSVCF